jgi:peptidoglycan hydrolase-like protein with peptidoglycan-binding domain
MIELGCFDAGTPDALCRAYVDEVARLTRVPLAEVAAGRDRITLQTYAPAGAQAMTVAEVQRALRDLGFFPGGKDDGICGYRTQSAIRLFQEAVRTVDGVAAFVPDGRFGPASQGQLKRWLSEGRHFPWAGTVARWQAGEAVDGEYGQWLDLLQRVKAQRLQQPGPLLEKVNAHAGRSDTRKPAQWDFSGRENMQLIGVRRAEATGKFDDPFVLLAKGLVFKFLGSTEPGSTKDPRGLPFLVPGQHDYHFGWHQRKYLALRPLGSGVLVLRSRNDKTLDTVDLAGALEANASINIHWGGRGLKGDINDWSEGCQVINGSLYQNPEGKLIDCTAFAALTNGEVNSNPSRTRAAYNVLVDVVTALGSDLSPTVKYTLLTEEDLALHEDLAQHMAQAREAVWERIG